MGVGGSENGGGEGVEGDYTGHCELRLSISHSRNATFAYLCRCEVHDLYKTPNKFQHVVDQKSAQH